jgi:hypothetical protein
MNNKVYIILNDFRSVPFTAAVNIAAKYCRNDIVFVTSNRFIDNIEYGQYMHPLYKKLKLSILKIFYKVEFAPTIIDLGIDEIMRNGILSSLQSITTDSDEDFDKYPKLTFCLTEQAKGSKEISNYLLTKEISIKSAYLFNGRTASSSSLTYHLFYRNIKTYYYEHSSTIHGYRYFNFPMHDVFRFGEEVYKYWKYSLIPVPDLFKRGLDFEKKKLTNIFVNRYSENVNDFFDIVIFLGSDFEYKNLQPEIVNLNYVGNLGLLKYVISKYGSHKKIAVRAHPNQITDPSWAQNLRPIIQLCDKFSFQFISPSSKVSSYDLIRNSNLIVVEYSTIALDTIFLGAEVDIVGNQEAKFILSSLSNEIIKNPYLRSKYVREIMSLHTDLGLHKFQNLCFEYLTRIDSFFERIFFSNTPHL